MTPAMLPRWELTLYLLASLGFHLYSFYEVYKVSRGKTPRLSDDLFRREWEGSVRDEDSGGHCCGHVVVATFCFLDVCTLNRGRAQMCPCWSFTGAGGLSSPTVAAFLLGPGKGPLST